MLSVFFLLLTIGFTAKTYGLFETNPIATPNLTIAKWKILVDNQELETEKEITLSDFEFRENEKVEDGYFAPGTEATYEIEVDTSESEVAIDYEIIVDSSALEEHPNIKVTVTDMQTATSSGSSTFTGTINLEDLNTKRYLKISIIWEDDSNYDEKDTELIDQELPIKLKAKFTQHI